MHVAVEVMELWVKYAQSQLAARLFIPMLDVRLGEVHTVERDDFGDYRGSTYGRKSPDAIRMTFNVSDEVDDPTN